MLAAAGELNLSVAVLSLSNRLLSDDALRSLVDALPPATLLLIEDVDCVFKTERTTTDQTGVTLSGLLNALDGVSSREGRVLFLTTNHPERLDPALVRPGRVDRKIELGNATPDQARRLFLWFFQGCGVGRASSSRWRSGSPPRSPAARLHGGHPGAPAPPSRCPGGRGPRGRFRRAGRCDLGRNLDFDRGRSASQQPGRAGNRGRAGCAVRCLLAIPESSWVNRPRPERSGSMLGKAPAEAEGDTNLSPRRRAWVEAHLDEPTRELVRRDARVFLHQSVSTPCLSADPPRRGDLDRGPAGPAVHGFPRQQRPPRRLRPSPAGRGDPASARRAVVRARRYTCEPAVELAEKLAEIAPGSLSKVLFAPSGSDAIEMALAYARAATGRYKTISFWDSYHGAGFGARSVGGEAMFRSGPIGPLLGRDGARAPFGDYRNAWGVTEGSAESVRQHNPVHFRERARRRRGDRRAGPRRAVCAAAGLLAERAAGVRRVRRALDLRRDPDRAGQDGDDVRLRARRGRARHRGRRQEPGGRHPADRGA